MPGSAFDPTGFSRRAAALVIGATIAAGAAGVGWWQTHLSTSPSCQITAPAAGTVTGTVPITATCGATATQVRFIVNSGQVASAAALPFNANWNSALIADGTYSLTAVAEDAAGNTVTSSPVSITTSNGVSGGGGAGTANVWLSAFGSDANVGCAYHSSAISDPGPTSDCATPQKACNLITAAAAGGVVSVNAGAYAVPFTLTGCNPSGTITYTNTTGFVEFEPAGAIGPNVSNVTLQGGAIGYGVGFSLSKTNVVGNAAPNGVTNLTWNNINLYCQVSDPWVTIHSNLTNEDACSSEISINGNVNSFTWNGGDQEAWASCKTSCTNRNNGGNNPNDNQLIGSTPTTILIEHVTFANFFSLDNNGSAGDHSEIWKIDQASGATFLDDKIIDCAPPASTGYAINNSCNSGYIFFGQNGTNNTADTINFTQDVIAPGEHVCTGCTKQVAFSWSYDVPATHEISITFLYNTLDGGLTLCGSSTSNKCGPGCPSGAGCSDFTGVNTTWVGNVANYTGFGNCYPSGTYSHNVWFTLNTNTAAKCSAGTDTAITNTTAATLWLSPNDPSYDYTPLAVLQAAGENAFCPATDINGVARPTLTPCDAGAIQH